MKELEDILEKLKQAIKEREVDLAPVQPPRVSGGWDRYVNRAFELINKAILQLKAFKDALYKEPEISLQENKYALILIEKDVIGFVGIDNKPYGPYRRNDVAVVPKETAEILVKHGLAKYLRI